MDVTPYLTLKTAPQVLFDKVPELHARPRFLLPEGKSWRAVTWGAFGAQVREAGLALEALGLQRGDRACVFSANRVEWMSAALGIQSVGGVMVPIYPANTAEQAAYVVTHSDAKVVFVDGAPLLSRLLEVWSQLGNVLKVVLLDDALDPWAVADELRKKGKPTPGYAELERRIVRWSPFLRGGEALHRDAPDRFGKLVAAASLDEAAVMLYTSGTSGNPKGVPLTHRNVGVNGADWLRCNGPLLEEGLVDLLWLPMSHIFGFGEACLGNTLGFTTYMVDPVSAVTRLPEVRPSVLMAVPLMWEKLATSAMPAGDAAAQRAKLAELTGGKLRFCLSGGAGLKVEVKQFLHQHGLLVMEGYGLTECSPTLTLNRPDSFRFDTVGKAVPSIELKLAEDGEILAKGQSVFRGYHKDPAATQEAFTADGWFKTGDVGQWTEDGFLKIVDRKKDILVTAGGKNVAPANIELRFADHAHIAHVVVYGDAKKFLSAGVWLNPLTSPQGASKAELEALAQRSIDRVNSETAAYEQIKKFVLLDRPLTVENGLLTSTLKVRRKKVYEAFRAELEALHA